MKKFHSKREKIMEIRQLETFVHVAQLQSFSRAAEVLGYTQSAITVQIRLLENELETRLLTEPESVWCLLRLEKSLWGMQAGSYMM